MNTYIAYDSFGSSYFLSAFSTLSALSEAKKKMGEVRKLVKKIDLYK